MGIVCRGKLDIGVWIMGFLWGRSGGVGWVRWFREDEERKGKREKKKVSPHTPL